jgi:hypothetical protein
MNLRTQCSPSCLNQFSWNDERFITKWILKEVGCEDAYWVRLIQDLFQRRALVKTVMNLRVREKTGIFWPAERLRASSAASETAKLLCFKFEIGWFLVKVVSLNLCWLLLLPYRPNPYFMRSTNQTSVVFPKSGSQNDSDTITHNSSWNTFRLCIDLYLDSSGAIQYRPETLLFGLWNVICVFVLLKYFIQVKIKLLANFHRTLFYTFIWC